MINDEYIADKPCMNTQHNPPTHLYVPPGQSYEHTCPTCGAKSTIHSAQMIC